MAIDLIAAVLALPAKAITATQRLVLTVLVNYMRKRTGGYTEAFVGVPRLVRETSLTRRGVQGVLSKLVDREFIRVEGVVLPRRATRYAVNVDRLMRAADCERATQWREPAKSLSVGWPREALSERRSM